MNVLILGAAGFVGSYLIRECQKNGWSVSATKLPHESFSMEGVPVYDCDLLAPGEIDGLLARLRPDGIFHLAAQSSVAVSWKKPDLTLDVNIKGCVHLLEALRGCDWRPRVLLVGSGEEYGHIRPGELPVSEETLPRPGNIYAATKAAQNMLGRIYADAYDLNVMMVRAFNHIGPDQAPLFVVPDFCRQAAQIEKGLTAPEIRVGNLSARRDFTDVRDVVRAYCEILMHGEKGETYNVGSGKAVSIESILKKILSLTKVPVKVTVDPEKLRPVDVPVIEADIGKLKGLTGWEPVIPIETTIEETLNYWREKV